MKQLPYVTCSVRRKPSVPHEDVAAALDLANFLCLDLYEYLKTNPEAIHKKHDLKSGETTYTVRLLPMRYVDPTEKGQRICTRPPDISSEDWWAQAEEFQNCPRCNGTGHVDDIQHHEARK